MTWRKNDDTATWEEYFPGHHGIMLSFNLKELKEQLNLVDK